jgi:hypothetical protein
VKICRSLAIALLCITARAVDAAPVTGWLVVDPQSGGSTSKQVFNALTDSPILGNGAVNSADMVAMYADISGVPDGSPDIALANGQEVTLSGFATMTGINASNEQFRWGLFQESVPPFNAIDWSGFIASNSSNSSGGALRAKSAGDGSTFAQTGSAVTLQIANDGDDFIDETYHFSLTVSRFNDELSVDASLTSADDWSQVWKDAIAIPPTPTTFNFNRVGFLSGGGMNADQVAFSNIDVTAAPIDALTLQVFTAGPDAGTVVLRNNRPESFEIEYYEVTSAGSLNFQDWTSLDEQEGNDNEFEGWEETSGNSAGLLSEYRLFSTLSVEPSATLSLGKAFEVGSPEDLKFFVGLADGSFQRGVVEYISEGLTGDFNRDNSVDAADYVAWRKGLGTTHVQNDYTLWRTHFNESVANGGLHSTTIPEPASVVMFVLSLAISVGMRRDSRASNPMFLYSVGENPAKPFRRDVASCGLTCSRSGPLSTKYSTPSHPPSSAARTAIIGSSFRALSARHRCSGVMLPSRFSSSCLATAAEDCGIEVAPATTSLPQQRRWSPILQILPIF